MSPKWRKDVSQLVEKYRREFPNFERPFLRRLIRVEHPELFKNTTSKATNLKALDRHLRRAFKKRKTPETKEPPKTKTKEKALAGLGVLDWVERRAEGKRLEKERKREKRYRQMRVWVAGEQLDLWHVDFKQKYHRNPTTKEEWEKVNALSEEYEIDPSEILTSMSK